MTGMSIDHIEHVLNTYEQINCQSVFISFWYLGTSAYVPRGPRPLPQRFEVPTPHSEIRVSQYQVPMILRVQYLHFRILTFPLILFPTLLLVHPENAFGVRCSMPYNFLCRLLQPLAVAAPIKTRLLYR